MHGAIEQMIAATKAATLANQDAKLRRRMVANLASVNALQLLDMLEGEREATREEIIAKAELIRELTGQLALSVNMI